MAHLSILGAGSWGIAVANLMAEQNHSVQLWKHYRDGAKRLMETRRDDSKLRGVDIHSEIKITPDLGEALEDAEFVVIAVPAQNVRHVCREINRSGAPEGIIVSLAKGIEVSSLRRVSEIVGEELGEDCGKRTVVLSGPSHAEEVARKVPTSVVAAGQDTTARKSVQQVMASAEFRVYTSDDVIGVELGGALKNVIALAAGMVYGLQLGDNTTGALLTRGLAEISRLGIEMGARPETFAGLSGLGDLVTTCISSHSRNRYVGERIGRGERLSDILTSMTMVAEGVETTRAAARLAERHQVEMPITEKVYEVLFNHKPPAQAVDELMTRELKSELCY